MESKGVYALEGLGYIAAILVGLAALADSPTRTMRLFQVGGSILAVVVVVRLLAFVALKASQKE
jgi:hypothetical protein